MKKIPSLFIRDFDNNPRYVTTNINPVAQWVIDGEGTATRKYDGTCCLIEGGQLWKRYEVKKGKEAPYGFKLADKDEKTGKQQGWVEVGNDSNDKWHREAFALKDYEDGTYELVGPKVQGNPELYEQHELIKHSEATTLSFPRDYESIKKMMKLTTFEGVVWHHPDGRMVKIKKKDFDYSQGLE